VLSARQRFVFATIGVVKLRTLHRRRLAAWFASIAILLQAVAPALAFAHPAPQGAAEIEVCTSRGIEKIAVGADDQSGGPRSALDHHVHHCVLCHSGGGAMPAAGLRIESAAPAAVNPAAPTVSAIQPPNPFLAWFVLHKHGPPLPT